MSDRLSHVHRALLWLMALQGVLGVAFLVAPGRVLDVTQISAPIQVNSLVRVAGAFIVATAITAGFALRSDSWAQARLFTWFVAVAYMTIVIIRISAIAAGTAGDRWQAGILELVIGLGCTWESVRRAIDARSRRQPTAPVNPDGAPLPRVQ